MWLQQCIFLFTILYLQCGARQKNVSLDQLGGPWVISNASQNALSYIGDCPSVYIEPPPKRSRGKEGRILLKTQTSNYTLTIVAMDQSTYQFYISKLSPLGNVSVLTAESNTFLVAEVKIQDETYYAVLTNENKTSEKVDKKIWKFWNSFESTKNVPLFPIKQENCQISSGDENNVDYNAVHITSITVEETYITREELEYELPVAGSDGPVNNTYFETDHPEFTTSSTLEVTSGKMTAIPPHVTKKLSETTDSRISMGSSNGSTSATENITQSLPPMDTKNNSLNTEPSISAIVTPNLIFILMNAFLLVIYRECPRNVT